MIVHPWPPTWAPSVFELRLVPNQRTFVGPYTPMIQVIDLLGERWALRFDLPPSTSEELSAAREAFFDRLKGAANAFSIHHFMSPYPRGTLRSNTTLAAAADPLADTLALHATTGETLLPGDMLSVNSQLMRVMAKAAAVANVLTVEVQGRARTALTQGSAVVLIRPTANFILRNADGVGVTWRNDRSDGLSIEAIEVWT